MVDHPGSKRETPPRFPFVEEIEMTSSRYSETNKNNCPHTHRHDLKREIHDRMRTRREREKQRNSFVRKRNSTFFEIKAFHAIISLKITVYLLTDAPDDNFFKINMLYIANKRFCASKMNQCVIKMASQKRKIHNLSGYMRIMSTIYALFYFSYLLLKVDDAFTAKGSSKKIFHGHNTKHVCTER